MKNPGFTDSMRYILTGWKLLSRPGLRRFVWMPLLVNLAIFGGLGWWLNAIASEWLTSLSLFSTYSDWWIVGAFQTLLLWLLTIVLFFSMAFFFTLLANLIGAPFNSLLAERVEAYLVGESSEPAPPVLHLIKSLPRLMVSELSKLFYLLACLLPLLLLQFVPVINFIAPLLLFLFGAWMFTLEYMDYPMGNHGALFREVRTEMRKNRRSAYGFGCIVAFLSSIPLINLVIMPTAVAGATALYVDHYRQQHLQAQV